MTKGKTSTDEYIVTPNEYDAYIGSFARLFSFAEGALRTALAHNLGLDDVGLRTLLSGARAATLVSFFNRLYNAKGIPKPAELESGLAQFSVIAEARNQLMHFTLTKEQANLIARNSQTAVSAESVTERTFSIDSLRDLTDDAWRLGLHFAAYLNGVNETTRQKLFELSMPGPWRYKPLPLKSEDRANPVQGGRRRLRPPPPRASRAKPRS